MPPWRRQPDFVPQSNCHHHGLGQFLNRRFRLPVDWFASSRCCAAIHQFSFVGLAELKGDRAFIPMHCSQCIGILQNLPVSRFSRPLVVKSLCNQPCNRFTGPVTAYGMPFVHFLPLGVFARKGKGVIHGLARNGEPAKRQAPSGGGELSTGVAGGQLGAMDDSRR